MKRRNHDADGPKRITPHREEPLSDGGRTNLQAALTNLLSTMCQIDCWPVQSTVKTHMVNEACVQANSAVDRRGDKTTYINKFFLADVSVNCFIILIPFFYC